VEALGEAFADPRREQDDESREADGDADPALGAEAFAAGQEDLKEGDEEWNHGEEESGESGREELLAPDQAHVSQAEHEDAHDGKQAEIAPGLSELEPEQRAEAKHQRAGDEEANAGEDVGRENRDTEADGDVGRSPEEVDAGKGEGDAAGEFGRLSHADSVMVSREASCQCAKAALRQPSRRGGKG
jgi:hypothetical protein